MCVAIEVRKPDEGPGEDVMVLVSRVEELDTDAVAGLAGELLGVGVGAVPDEDVVEVSSSVQVVVVFVDGERVLVVEALLDVEDEVELVIVLVDTDAVTGEFGVVAGLDVVMMIVSVTGIVCVDVTLVVLPVPLLGALD